LVKKFHIWGGHSLSWWIRMAEKCPNDWIPEMRNLIIFKSPDHLMGGAKDKHKYRKIYYLSEK
jgi:hypothetical protein